MNAFHPVVLRDFPYTQLRSDQQQKKKNSIHFSTYNIYGLYVNHNSCKLNELFTKKRINFTLFAELGFFEKGENAPPAPNDN